MTLRRIAPLLALALVAGLSCSNPPLTCPQCTTPRAVNPQLGQDFELAPRDTAVIGSTTFRVIFDGVLGDSRCPSDVTCVWAGSAAVRLLVTEDGVEKWSGTLNSGQEPRTIVIGAYELALVGVGPAAARSGMGIPPQNYRATLKVTAK